MRMKHIILAALVGMLVSGSAWAAERPTIGKFLDVYDRETVQQKQTYESSFGFMGEGMQWINRYEGRSPVYCPPENLSITNGQYFSIFRNFAEKKESRLKEHIWSKGFMLLRGLIEAFPCKK